MIKIVKIKQIYRMIIMLVSWSDVRQAQNHDGLHTAHTVATITPHAAILVSAPSLSKIAYKFDGKPTKLIISCWKVKQKSISCQKWKRLKLVQNSHLKFLKNKISTLAELPPISIFVSMDFWCSEKSFRSTTIRDESLQCTNYEKKKKMFPTIITQKHIQKFKIIF